MSRLEDISVQYRDALITKNDYKDGAVYNAGHPDALSTGDEAGKGETNTVGGKTNIETRDKLITKNMYNSGKEYNAGSV